MDALADLGITSIQTPISPMKVWEAIRDARANAA
jgi:carbon-monoxide dehydrogenase large subunit